MKVQAIVQELLARYIIQGHNKHFRCLGGCPQEATQACCKRECQAICDRVESTYDELDKQIHRICCADNHSERARAIRDIKEKFSTQKAAAKS